MFFWNFKNVLSYHDKAPPLSIAKVLFWGFGCKIQTKQPFKKTLTRFWTVNSVKYENVIIGALKHNTSNLELRKGKTKVGKQVRVFNKLFSDIQVYRVTSRNNRDMLH